MISTIIMAGDRIPLALSLMGVGLLALGLPQFRKVAVVGGVLVAIVGGILALNSQAVAVRVDKTVQQLSHFWESPYGLIYSNAFEMAQEKPLLGYGLSGYRAVCPVFAESRGRDKKLVCNLHPHNTYLEWGTEGGLVGLAIFLGLVGMWGVVFARGLWVAEAPVYPLVLAAVIPVFLYLWPIQSSMSFFSNQNATMFWFVLAQALAWTSRPRQAV